jgi:hypothetical protein
MLSLPAFSNPTTFEKVLQDIATNVLSEDRASLNRNQRVGEGSNTLELDFVFEPYDAYGVKKIYIFEFKYTNSYTLPDSLVYTQFARFSALRQANRNFQLKFLLITNADIPRYLEIPNGMSIFSEIRDGNVFESKLREWLSHELPNFRQSRKSGSSYSGLR